MNSNLVQLFAVTAVFAGFPMESNAGVLSTSQQYWFDGPAFGDTCTPKILGTNLDVRGHDLLQLMDGITDESDCAAACCANSKCGGALFEPISAVKYGGCVAGKPCCFLKTSVAGSAPGPVVKGGSTLIEIPSRSQDDEKLTFLSSTLGNHMVLQQAPQKAVVWGFTTPGATVHTTMRAATGSQTFTTTAVKDGTWRQQLPPTPASKTPYDFDFTSGNQTASMTDVLFGEVFICGGQSNMEFAMPAVANHSTERQLANDFPTIRFLSVGHSTQSPSPLRNLQTVWEPWQVASNLTIDKDFSPGHTLFSTFSAVCWLFGRHISTSLSETGDVPVGLVSNNWGGTKVEVWVPSTAYDSCQRTGPAGPMYNAMVLPFAEGPMALAGFAWYQGEANTANATTAVQYGCLFPEMIKAWRAAFAAPDAFFGFIQLSTWCALPAESLPQMRSAQMLASTLTNVGWATNADHGAGCNIHPSPKQAVSTRLANAALAVRYKKQVAWKSPTYKTSAQLSGPVALTVETVAATAATAATAAAAAASITVTFNDVGADGLELVFPFNYDGWNDGVNGSVPVDCTASYPCGPNQNCSMTEQCAWAGLEVAGAGWVNATVAVSADGQGLVLTATLPAASGAAAGHGPRVVTGSSYGWGPIPMMSAYDKATGLPVLPWNTTA